MAKSHTTSLTCRQELFRAQVVRFSHCEDRWPTRSEIRALWHATGFRTA